ncbi:prephenate dehydratase [uncultured Thomasclavelia sp.]|uniref:prephenate dehydratase n=1 Tax=uncultured Thomasclavelia sp. TaxID=3025759 RepID=UPI0025F3618F|nr:prephenate dehydratase [uncultured Thomasclavelia sp.]
MKDLKQCRKEIDEIDQQLIKLFEQRMSLSKEVVTYKLAHDLEIFQPQREHEVIEKNVGRLKNSKLQEYAREFVQDIMDVGKSYQATFIPLKDVYHLATRKSGPIKVGYAGVPGAFAHQAMLEYFGDVDNCNYENFKDVYEALKNDQIDYGIVPLENSSTGAINDNYDLVRDYDFYIVGEHSVAITQHLLGIKGAKLSDIKDVYSHPQGIMQSSNFISEHPSITTHDFSNTAAAAKFVSESHDITKGAIASKIAASLYNLDVIAENIHNEQTNNTRFIIFGKQLEDHQNTDRVSIVFTLEHQVGSLSGILKTIKDHHINLSRIESRPIKDKYWQYYFYIDFEGSLHDDNVKLAIEQMKTKCLTLRVIGNYQHA